MNCEEERIDIAATSVGLNESDKGEEEGYRAKITALYTILVVPIP